MTTTNADPQESNSPKYYAFRVIEGNKRGQKSSLDCIGAFFVQDGSNGGTLILDSLPIAFEGPIVLLPFRAE